MDVIDHYRVVPCLVRKLFDNGLTRSARHLKSTLNTVPVGKRMLTNSKLRALATHCNCVSDI